MALDAEAYPAIVALAKATGDVGVPPEWYLAIFALESGLRPDIGNQYGYEGLNQIASSTLRSMGVIPTDYLTWPASRQIREVITPWYTKAVKTSLGRSPKSIGGLYAVNLAPGIVQTKGDDPSVVLYATPSKAYVDNAGLDLDHSGSITVSDLDQFLARVQARQPYLAALPHLKAVEGDAPLSPKTLATAGAVLGGSLLLAWGIRSGAFDRALEGLRTRVSTVRLARA